MSINSNRTIQQVSNPFDKLTKRQLEVVKLYVQGLSPNEVAKRLDISVKTFDSHRGAAMRVLNVDNNVQLTLLAIKHGIVTVELA